MQNHLWCTNYSRGEGIDDDDDDDDDDDNDGQGCPLFDGVHLAFLLPTTASSILQGALEDGFAEVVVACDMPQTRNKRQKAVIKN